MLRHDETSRDAIFRGEISVLQRRHGYRFSIDALLLAWYASMLPGNRFLELCAGSGVVSLALASRREALSLDAVEIQQGLAGQARQNVQDNGLAQVSVHHRDLRTIVSDGWAGIFDAVLANPPYRPQGQGRLNPDPEKAIARHELQVTLADILNCAAHCLRTGGYLALILLAERRDDLQNLASATGLTIVQHTDIRPYPDREANLFLTLLGKGSVAVLPDWEFFIWEEKGVYAALVKDILAGHWQGLPHPLHPGMSER